MTEHIDKHGFLSDRRTHEVPLTPFQVNARIEKWHHMLSN